MLPLLLAIVPYCEARETHVDVIEINHIHDESANETFSQFIFWQDSPDGERVVAWRLWKGQLPERTKDGYRVWWMDGDTPRKVTATSYRRTWTQCYDAEIENRKVFCKDKRRGLLMPLPKDCRP